MTVRLTTAVLAILVSAVAADAQTVAAPDRTSRPWATAGTTIGPIYFAPTFEVRGVGIDKNVFNDPSNPKSDVTGTLGLKSIVGIHWGESLVLQLTQDNSYVYYRRYRSERSIDNGLGVVAEWRTASFRPWISFAKAKSGQRVNDEIDARASRKTPNFTAGIDIDAGFRVGISGAVRHGSIAFADDEEFQGVKLADVLNNTSDTYQGFLSYEVSELTDFVVGADYSRDRFKVRPDRDNDTAYYYAALNMRSGAALVGQIGAGWKQQRHIQSGVPDFSGATVSMNLGVIPSEYLKFDVSAARDISYSYLEAFPYVIDTKAGTNIVFRPIDHIDAVLRYDAHWAHYSRSLDAAAAPYNERTSLLHTELGYYVGGGTGTRIGLQFERAQRTSPIDARVYKTNRISTNYRFSF